MPHMSFRRFGKPTEGQVPEQSETCSRAGRKEPSAPAFAVVTMSLHQEAREEQCDIRHSGKKRHADEED